MLEYIIRPLSYTHTLPKDGIGYDMISWHDDTDDDDEELMMMKICTKSMFVGNVWTCCCW